MISSELSKVIDDAVRGVSRHPERRLSLALRKRVWAALGPRLSDGEDAPRGVGLRRRTTLAILCARRVLPSWERVFPGDRQPHMLLTAARLYRDEELERYAAWDKMNDFWAVLESLLATEEPGWATLAGCAAAKAVKVSIYDELFDTEDEADGAEDGPDRAADFYEWDAALYASMSHSREGYYDETSSSSRREEFWMWYLREAVPASINAFS